MTRAAEILTLRPYQLAAVDQLRERFKSGERRLVLVAPTGAGKTCIAAAMIKASVARGRRVLFIAHRRELITQAAAKLEQLGVSVGIIMAGEQPNPAALVQVASIQTLARRDKPPADLVVVDECHHSTADSWRAVLSAYADAYVIGLTATPWRTDRVGLSGLYEGHVLAATPAELIVGGALCRYDVVAFDAPDLHQVRVQAGEYNQADLAIACNTSILVGNVVDEYQRSTPGRCALVFAVDVEHSRAIVGEFIAKGISARHVDYKSSLAERAAAVADTRAGKNLILSSVSLFSEGFDLPCAEVCIMARPTLSLSLHLQMIGRAMRTSPGKETAMILDHGGNLLRHGLPDDERDYSLTATPKRVAEMHRCPFCFRVFGKIRDDGACPKCGEIIAPPVEVREANERRRKEQIEGERLNAEKVRELRRQRANAVPESAKVMYFLQLKKKARANKYQPSWVGVQFKLRYGYWPKFTAAQIAAAMQEGAQEMTG